MSGSGPHWDPVYNRRVIPKVLTVLQKVPAELHLFAEGGHAFGLRPTKAPITKLPALV